MYGAKIAAIRVARGFTQDYMADKLGIAQNIYSKIEKDDRKTDEQELTKIAEILGVSVVDIKSPTPIIMNFDHSMYNVPFGTQHNYTNEKLLDEMIAQLKEKDKQISELIAAIKR